MTSRPNYLRTSWAMVTGTGLIFLAIAKLSDVPAFRGIVRAHGFVPESLLSTVAAAVPAMELVIGLTCIGAVASRSDRRWPLLLVAALFAGMTAYAVVLAVRPPASPVPCGCGLSTHPVENWWLVAVRNASLCGITVLAARLPAGRVRQP